MNKFFFLLILPCILTYVFSQIPGQFGGPGGQFGGQPGFGGFPGQPGFGSPFGSPFGGPFGGSPFGGGLGPYGPYAPGAVGGAGGGGLLGRNAFLPLLLGFFFIYALTNNNNTG